MKPIFQHITAPVDGSATSKRGVTFAATLAGDGGRISFCSVVDPVLACTPAAQGAGIDFGTMLEVLDEDAALFCRTAQAEVARCGIVSDMLVLHGTCVDEIHAFAAANASDAIVIGTHGRGGFSRALFGSVAEAVVRTSDIPVVCVHESDELRSGPLAVALDSSPAALAALELGIAIAAARGMSLLIILVCNTDAESAAVNTLLADVAAQARFAGIAPQIVRCDGPTAERLLTVAREYECCMIVMGTHGRAPLERLFLGSVAAAVIERADTPVMTIKTRAPSLVSATASRCEVH